MMDLAAFRMRDTVLGFGDMRVLYEQYAKHAGAPVDLHAVSGRVLAGVVHFYDAEKNAWSILKEKVPMGPYHNIAKYNPAEHAVILGAGGSAR